MILRRTTMRDDEKMYWTSVFALLTCGMVIYIIEFLREQLDKALADIEELKDKVRENKNGNGAH
jgi:hypothetical protein